MVKEILKQVDEHVETHETKIVFEPLRSKDVLEVVQANNWKSKGARYHRSRTDLITLIAIQLELHNGWVFFHFDGDRPWAARDSSENRQKFKELIWEPVRLKIQERLVGRKPELATRTEEVKKYADARMARLKTVVPFYSIEAWLFQNTREAIRLCKERYGGRDVEQFNAWAQDRTMLDEVLKPKEAVCLGAVHNLELASTGFPAREVRAAGRSFTAIVEALSQDSELREALARTYAYG
ncbi:MAG TPA: hypothetical protein VFZ09_00530 [Archangium sp.]|uniref:hypothetical protein n=1 Tax=Archangium sp. TaxID=1872627 RepID=UPI002E37C54A|nr:hypothetical protein [Archangium sp.]HEX5744691.1 hypothetical protein [Archangium sp.]